MADDFYPSDRSLESDTPEMKLSITRLLDLGIRFERKTEHQLKIGKWNFYPARGTIYCDDAPIREAARGLEAFLSILAKAREAAKSPNQRYRRPQPTGIE